MSLALAVASDPELLILDDPTLGLDTVVRRDFLESLIQIIQRRGRTIFFSSHILGDVERVADRIGILVDGVLRVDCPTEHFKDSIRSVVLEFAGPPPEFPPCPGLVGSRQVGRTLVLIVVGWDETCRRQAESLQPLDPSPRDEPGRRFHRIHPRAAPPAADFFRKTNPMWKAIVYKELRENLGLGLLALAVYLFMAATWIGVRLLPWNTGQQALVPFVQDGFFAYFGWNGRAAGHCDWPAADADGVGRRNVALSAPPANVPRAGCLVKAPHGGRTVPGFLGRADPGVRLVGGYAGHARRPIPMVDDAVDLAVVALDHGRLPWGIPGRHAARAVDRLPGSCRWWPQGCSCCCSRFLSLGGGCSG